ncbi:MAG TPA: PepSY-associated TM helix domain-containing protein, partial [Pyrinomonadaceae bacterium]
AFRNVLWYRRGLRPKARDFNWHNVVGFWSAAPLFVVVLSAVVISYAWAGNLVYRVAGEQPPQQQQRPQQPARGGPQPELAPEGLNGLWARAAEQQAGWRSISLRLPTAADKTATFTIDGGTGGQPQKRAQLTLDRRTGAVSKWEPFSSYTLGRRLRSYLRFAHTGEVFGVVGQTIAGIASAGGALLVWTGLTLAWRRWRAWARRPTEGAREAIAGADAALAQRAD